MADYGTDNRSTIWGIAAAAGVVAFLIFKFLMSYAFWPALFLAVLIAILVALLVWIGFYKGSDDPVSAPQEPAPVAKPAAAPSAAQTPEPAPAAADTDTKEDTGAQQGAGVRADGFANGLMGDAGNRLKKETAAKNSMPKGIDAPRGGQADDLKRIKGIGPKLEQMLNGMGYYHFDQIAEWGAGEVSWVDENLQGFKGRVSRDNWVDQARVLASGEETEFSKRVDDGEVY